MMVNGLKFDIIGCMKELKDLNSSYYNSLKHNIQFFENMRQDIKKSY